MMYVASVPASNAHLKCAFVGAFATHQWTSAMLDGRCIRKFIMPSSRTESESADFFTKPSESVHLRDFENRNNTNILYIYIYIYIDIYIYIYIYIGDIYIKPTLVP